MRPETTWLYGSCRTIACEGGACRAHSAFAVLLLSSLLAGCGGAPRMDVAPTRGTVTLDGEPLGTGTVIFLPKAGLPARGTIGPDGSFVLGTYSDDDGAIVGPHRVAVVAQAGEAPTEENPRVQVVSLAPSRYASPQTSGLTAEINADTDNVLILELTR